MGQDGAGASHSRVDRRCIPLVDFGEEMLKAHEAFAERVDLYAQRFGPVSPDTLALLAQAAYFCWFEAEFESDLLSLCGAIGRGCPSAIRLCQQVTAER